ncbi:MAG: M28 family peptidase [Saprospiraceae bacterium]
MNKSITLIVFLFFGIAKVKSQAPMAIDLSKAEIEQHIRFLAADELQGRFTGSPGNNTAARYIAEYLRAQGCAPAPGAEDFFQVIRFESVRPPQSSEFRLGKKKYKYGEDYFLSAGEEKTIDHPAVFAQYGWLDESAGINDYEGLDVKGKLVIVWSGKPGSRDPQEALSAMKIKRKLAAERGAAGLIEVFRLPFPWHFILNYLNKESLAIADPDDVASDGMIYGMLNEKSDEPFEAMKSGKVVESHLYSSGVTIKRKYSSNVAAMLEGSDPLLKDEYLLISAHYDHIGVAHQGGGFPFGAQDSIFNGARDNAIGTVGLMMAAKVMAVHRPKRSVLFLALTAEEQGLVGSHYYVNHPLIPLEQTIFNFNSDGAGYSDTSLVAIMGYDRTGVAALIDEGAAAFGLRISADPAPEQGLFDRSDNVSFAQKGVPSLNYSPGFTAFDEALMRNYHQVTDEAATLDFDYVLRYCKAFVQTTRLIADMENRPFWIEGDKYEAAGKRLYEKK